MAAIRVSISSIIGRVSIGRDSGDARPVVDCESAAAV